MTGKLSNGPMRRLCLFLAAFLLLAAMLCGCGPAPAAPTQPTAPTPPTAAPTEPTQPPAPSGDGPVVINAPEIFEPLPRIKGLWCNEPESAYTGVITFSVPEELYDSPDVHFLVTTDSGGYYINGSYTQLLDIPNHTTLYWERSYDPTIGWINPWVIHKDMEAHNRIIIYDDTHIIGYAVLRYDALPTYLMHLEKTPEPPAAGEFVLYEMTMRYYALYYRVVIVESVIFPKIDGRHQDIPPEYIQARFDDSCLCWKSDLSGLPE